MSTTKDPVRLLADPGCPDAQRELLRHGVNIEPPRGAEARVWQGLAGAIGATALGEAADASTKTAATATKVEAAGLTGTKIVALVAALVTLVGVGAYAVFGAGRADPRPSASVALVPVVPAPAPTPAPAPPLPAAGDTAPWDDAATAGPGDGERARPAPGARRSTRAPAASPPNRLRVETTLIKEARQALREGDAARALRLLQECRRLFPAGVLEQERERLTIEALARGGRAADASARAAEFLRKYPDSPHASEVRAFDRGAP